MEEAMIKKLMSSIKCSSCGQYYKAPDIDILGHQDDLWFVRAVCSACQAQYLVAAVVQEEKHKVVSDLTMLEQGRFTKNDTICPDDVLDMHQFLNGFNGDISQLFAEKQQSD